MWWTMVTALLVSGEGDGVVREAIVLDQAGVAKRATVASAAGDRAGAEVDGARARADGLDVRFHPKVGLSARYTRIAEQDPSAIDPGIPGVSVTIPAPKPDQWAFGLQVALPVSDWFLRAGDASEAGARGVAAARWRAESERRRAALEAVLVYWDLVRVREAEGVAAESLDDVRARLAETDKRARAQVASAADLRLAEARVAEVEGQRASLGHTRRLLEAQLGALLDLPIGAAIEVAVEPAGAALPGVDADVAELVAEAWSARPEPRALLEAEAALRMQLGLERVGRLPRLDVVANAQLVNPNPRAFPQDDELVGTWDVSAVVSWSVDALWTTGPGEDEVRARTKALGADRRALDDGLRLEIELALRTMRDGDARRATGEVMRAAAEEGYRVRTKLYALGQATALEVTEAETQLERARLGIVDARIERRIGEARLAYALGREL